MSISLDDWRFADRVDNVLEQRGHVLSRIDENDIIDLPSPTIDRLGKVSCRIDFWSRWVNESGRRIVRRVSVRISEIRGGYSFTQFVGGRAVYVANTASFNALSVYERVRVIH